MGKYKSKYRKIFKKNICSKIDRILEHIENSENSSLYNTKKESKCSNINTDIEYEFNDIIEDQIIEYLKLLFEYGSDNTNLNIHANDYYNIYIYACKMVNNPNYGINGNTQQNEEYFQLAFNKIDKIVRLEGSSVMDGNNSISIKYKKLDTYIDKLISFKSDRDKSIFLNNFNKVYFISDLSREKSFQDLELDK